MSRDLIKPSQDPWHTLKQFTPARIALGRAGISLPTKAHLDFQLAHAMARDAVASPLDFSVLKAELNGLGYETLRLESRAVSHESYLQRPDLGRLLSSESEAALRHAASQHKPVDLVIVVADGLSSKAIENHAAPLLRLLLQHVQDLGYALAPVCLVQHGRVAVGDAVSACWGARLCVVLIGERPGLSSPDSLGVYFTYGANADSTDADRNCISNIHHAGLSYGDALQRLSYLIVKADELGYSGVNLKDETVALLQRHGAEVT